MTNIKGERRSPSTCSADLENMELFLGHLYAHLQEKWHWDLQGMGAFQTGMTHTCYHGNTGRFYSVAQHAVGIVINKQVKDKILAERINVGIEHTVYSKSWDSSLKCGKENDQIKKEAKEKKVTRAHLKHQPALARKAHFVRTWEKEPELQSPVLRNSWDNKHITSGLLKKKVPKIKF